ncbi:MAG: excinuclease ABC subunit UvrA [Candidatus Anstonellales archaeon]
MQQDKIIIKGAREHNLKNINLEIPRNSLTVITGISGSGKSTLAFDTIYAEGQRRYVESLSSYARQFLGIMSKPDVDSIEGLSPAISIEQKSPPSNPRSTVGTITEIYDYLRLLYARIGEPYCSKCEKKITIQTTDAITDVILFSYSGKKVEILAPVVRGKKGVHEKIFERISQIGFEKVRVDGVIIDVGTILPNLDKNKKHNIEIVVDKVASNPEERGRLFEAVQKALLYGSGLVIVKAGDEEKLFSQKNSCPDCGVSIGELEPRTFSFNSPYGACEECHGLGVKMEFDPELVLDFDKSIADGGIVAWKSNIASIRSGMLETVGKKYGFDLFTPLGQMSKQQIDIILWGSDEIFHYKLRSRTGSTVHEFDGSFEGVIPNLERLYRETKSEWRREEIRKFMRERTCPACQGKRLKKEALYVKIQGKSIIDLCELPISDCYKFISSLTLYGSQKIIAEPVLKEIKSRLEFLINVGVSYLTLSRTSDTLSGGEMQRIRLATQIGSNLTGVIYVLDEPTVGLHQRDNERLISTLKSIREMGNTLIVVEHDEECIKNADYIIDLGPGAGENGGRVMFAGSPEGIGERSESITGQYLSKRLFIPIPKKRRKSTKFLKIKGCLENNLKNIDVSFPLGTFICITGVSGSGKSTLIIETLYKGLAQKIYGKKERPGKFSGFEGLDYIDKVVIIDQTPIGRTPRSNPATYTGVFTPIRELFAMTPSARMKGYLAGKFSFNVQGGRCEKCEGGGVVRIEMNFLPDIYVPCEECGGKRYNQEALSVTYKEKNIADVLEMSVDEAYQFFQNIPRIQNKLSSLRDVGLGYIKLGQPATTLSGGEAQRVKLSYELSKRPTGRTVYILDEPTIGLHFDDVAKLLDVLVRLVEKENTVIVIEHNLDVIKTADYIIDLGPEGGEAGGEIVATGTPEEIAKNNKSYTGQYLKRILQEN